MKKCSHFDECSQNLCPLDLELSLRTGGDRDKCKYMREPCRKKINGREFISGGSVPLDGVLKFVPESNLKWINESSRERWKNLKK